MVHILPYVEQDALNRALPLTRKNATLSTKYGVPDNDLAKTGVPQYLCPSDPRGLTIYPGGSTYPANTFTSYAATGGIDSWSDSWPNSEGILYWRSKTRIAGVTDGTSNTLMVGERPWSDADNTYGWWTSLSYYEGFRSATWEYDTVQYMANSGSSDSPFENDDAGKPCSYAPYYSGVPGYKMGQDQNLYGPGRTRNPCDFNHFWSPHTNGANFVLGDGSVRFLPYSAKPVMNRLTTRAGGEVTDGNF
jgi:prepilin-type processing-associated H-X9-DG protein